MVFAGVRKASDGDALLREWNSQRTRLESRSQNGIFRFLDYLLDNSYVPGGDIKYLLIDVAKTDTIKNAVAEVEKEITRSSGVGRPRGVYGVFANAGINAGCAFEVIWINACGYLIVVLMILALDGSSRLWQKRGRHWR